LKNRDTKTGTALDFAHQNRIEKPGQPWILRIKTGTALDFENPGLSRFFSPK
jgi:hypothetical protein